MLLCCVIFCVVTAPAFDSAYELNQKGVMALEAGRFDEAVGYLAEALRGQGDNEVIKSNLIAAYNNAALSYDKKGDFNKARSFMQQAYELAPDAKNVRQNFAFLLTNESFRRYNENRNSDIEGLLMDSLFYDGSLAQTHMLLGQVFYDRDDYRLAREQWEKALQLDPALPDAKKKMEKLDREMADESGRFDQRNYHFKVRYEGAELWTASREILDMLENAYAETGRKFGVYPDQPLTVVIYTQEKFQSITGAEEWFAGTYDGKIRLRRSDAEGNKERLKRIVFHEYMHAFVHFLGGNGVPVWLNEGIAQCYEDMPQKPVMTEGEKRLLKERLASGAPELAAIDRMFLSRDSAADVRFAYVYAKSFVGYLIDSGWDYNIKNLLDEFKKGSSADDAFNRVYFRSVDMMHGEWRRTGFSVI